ncbi:MAG: hypothetical protein HC796_05780 [Synechococcaceae cyanobacterium RL_1_2]|nr:hypothetical protein [Synechococcaceae cyanobacterium RL_1_2]
MKTLDLKKITTFYGIGVAAIGLLILGFQSFAIVEPGEVGVKITLGKTHRNYLDQGFHLKLPFITKVKTLSIAQQSLVLENLDGSSSEGNNIFLDTQLTYSLKPSEVVDFYINYKSINNFKITF